MESGRQASVVLVRPGGGMERLHRPLGRERRTGSNHEERASNDRDIVVAFQGLAMPTTAFVAADGTITSIHSGQLDAEALRARIDDELR